MGSKITKEIKCLVRAIALFLSLIGLSVFASGQTPAKDKTQRLVISFTSICCGIDHEAKQKLDDFIKQYEKAKGKPLTKSAVHWGKEGEIDYCLQLSELSRKQQKTFISQVRSLIGKSKLVDIKDNAACQSGR